MIAPRSLLFNVAFYLLMAAMMLIWLPALLGPRRWTVRGMELWAGAVSRLLAAICGIHIEVRGREHLPRGACIVAAKHQSAFDTIVFHALLDDPALVMKRELMLIPVYGWMARKTRMIPVDRAGHAGALKAMLRAAREAARAGRPIVIFPQGTRVAPGARQPYHPGVAALYRDLALPVVPVALNSGLVWPRRRFLRRPGTILLEFLAPIAPGLTRAAFMAELEARTEQATDRLLREGAAVRNGENTASVSGDNPDFPINNKW